VLRINVDKGNDKSVGELIEYLKCHLVTKEIKMTFGQVTAYTAACSSIKSSCYNNGEFAKQIVKYYEILKKHGFQKSNSFPYPETKLNYCCAELLNSFVIDHEDYLYKCWNLVGEVHKTVGNINEPSFDILGHKNGFWVARDPTEIEASRLHVTCEVGSINQIYKRLQENGYFVNVYLLRRLVDDGSLPTIESDKNGRSATKVSYSSCTLVQQYRTASDNNSIPVLSQ